ncbi:MAG: hypothetical protein IT428_20385 [Planctomycetaceae bacterium]|nr:hypothetical protein [Planctomycetaceae bacterium]
MRGLATRLTGTLRRGTAFVPPLALACVVVAQLPAANVDSVPVLPAEMVDAWKKAGATLHSGIVMIDGEKRRASPPLFRIALSTRGDEARWKDGRIVRLPAPQTPFGIALNAGIAPNSLLKDSFLKDLAGLEHLHCLSIRNGDVTNDGLKELTPLQNLRILRFSGTRIGDDGMKHVAVLSKLEELHIGQSEITDAGIAELAPLTKLEKLDAGDTRISGVGLGKFRALKTLNLNGAHIDNDGLAEIASLPELQTVDLNGTNITGTGLGRAAALRSLSMLSLRTELSDAGIRELASLTNLKTLLIEKLTDAHLKNLAGMTGLESLYLSDSRVTDTGLERLVALKGLQRLHLIRCPEVTGKGLAALAALPRLQMLGMSRIPIGVEGLESLSSLPALQTLWLNDDMGLAAQDLVNLTSANSLRSLNLNGFRKTDDGKGLSDAEVRSLKQTLRTVTVK